MKKILFTLLFSIVPLLFVSCTTDDRENEDNIYKIECEKKYNLEYYVKYKFKCGNNVHFTQFDIAYINKIDGKCIIEYKKYGMNTSNFHGSRFYEDEIICGPFNYNDTVSLTITNRHEVYFYNLEIYVSKDSSPFSLKKYENACSIKYIINY